MITRALLAVLLLIGAGNVVAWARCPNGSAGPSTSFSVTGDVATPAAFNLKRLQQLPAARANVTYFAAGVVTSESFTGPLLWDLLNSPSVGGIVTNPNIKNDILHKIIVVTGCDGYQATFGAGEVDPFFGGNQIMVAYASSGSSFPDDGVARIVAPGDKAGGRFVSIIDKIQVKDAGK